ncbi:hypothetical protein STA3757_34280 [Stanieria sp. NIES-3757]|nr:hypothetical protein STA3757_34280 [Stanieria sp. NIES-3757]
MANQPLNDEQKNNQSEPTRESKQSMIEQAVNPPELINQPNFPKNPEELLSNPAVAPQMLDDRRDLRGDLTRDEES